MKLVPLTFAHYEAFLGLFKCFCEMNCELISIFLHALHEVIQLYISHVAFIKLEPGASCSLMAKTYTT